MLAQVFGERTKCTGQIVQRRKADSGSNHQLLDRGSRMLAFDKAINL
jgi:hypothetical protein